MKKVLIIAHDFPPLTSIGAMRPESWFNYFKEFGLHPIVVTRNWDTNPNTLSDYYSASRNNTSQILETKKGTIIKAPFRPNLRDRLIVKSKLSIFRKFLTLAIEVLRYRTFWADDTRELFIEAEKYIKKNKIDFILATGEPWVSFRYAHILSTKYQIPWASDYRDGWNTDVSMDEISKIRKNFYLFVRGSIEKKYANSASFISISDPDIMIKNINYLKLDKNKFINPLNGYDEEKIEMLSEVKQSKEVFRIGYAGTVYSFQRVDMFIDGVAKFIEKRNIDSTNFKCLFIGSDYHSGQTERILNHNQKISKYFTTTARKSHLESLRELKSSNLLLLLCNDEFVALPAKLFEYFGLDRKILIVKNDKDVVENFVNMTNSGFLCNNVDDVYRSLCKSYDEFLEKGRVESTVLSKEIYSRKNQAKVLADKVLESI